MSNISRFEKARNLAVMAAPYFAKLLFSVQPHETDKIQTMGVTKDWVLMYNPEYIKKLTDGEAAAVLVHEANHLVRDHTNRVGARDHMLWNIAADIEFNSSVNETISGQPHDAAMKKFHEEFGLPEHAIYPATFGLEEGKLAEEYYELLKEMADEVEAGGGVAQGQCGSGADGSDPSGAESDGEVKGKGLSGYARERAMESTMEDIEAHEEKSAGTIPSGLMRSVENWRKRRAFVDWRSVLRGFVSWAGEMVSGGVDYNYTKPSRRNSAYAGSKLFMPSMVDYVPTIDVVFDTSGSMSQNELETVAVETYNMLQAMRCEARFLSVDAEVYEAGSDFFTAIANMRGGGGTNMSLPIEQSKADIIIVGTDGYTPWPEGPVKPSVCILMTEADNGHYANVPSEYVVVDASQHKT